MSDEEKNIKELNVQYEMIKDTYPLETIIVVSHGGVYKCIMAYVNGIPEDGNINIFDIDNCGIIEFDL